MAQAGRLSLSDGRVLGASPAARAGEAGAAYWFALAASLPIAWIGGTVLGAWLGSFMGDPARFGADFAFTALFIGLVAGFWRGRVTLITVAASGGAAVLTYLAAGPPWHIVAGAAAGIFAAYCAAGEKP